jgi:hypothetical protein
MATVMSYLPQYIRISRLRSTAGTSLLASFLTALAAQMQLVTMYYIFRNHSLDWDYGKIVATPPTFQDWLVLAQIVVQWACSLTLYVSRDARGNFHRSLTTQLPRFAHIIAYSPHDPRTNYGPNRRILSAGQIASALLILHAIFSLALILFAGKPAKYFNNIPFILIMAFHTDVVNPIATIFTIAACALQASRSSKFVATSRLLSGTSSANALSGKSLVLQMFTFLVLAVLWPFRFKMPRELGSPEDGWEWMADVWYPNVGWTCVNNAVIAVGQYVVLYILAGGDAASDQSLAGERQALLRSRV